jgi:F0F1-type ATP synthase epsilon subunit
MAASNTADMLAVKVFSPFETYYEGQGVSVSALNKTGPFDVLLGHAAFFSILLEGDVVIDTGSEKKAVPIKRGVIRVANNVVTVFTNV